MKIEYFRRVSGGYAKGDFQSFPIMDLFRGEQNYITRITGDDQFYILPYDDDIFNVFVGKNRMFYHQAIDAITGNGLLSDNNLPIENIFTKDNFHRIKDEIKKMYSLWG